MATVLMRLREECVFAQIFPLSHLAVLEQVPFVRTAQDLADRLKIGKAGIGAILNHLESVNLIHRKAVEGDRRTRRIAHTAAGESLLRRIQAILESAKKPAPSESRLPSRGK